MEVTIKSIDYSDYITRIYDSGIAVTYNSKRSSKKKNRENENNLKKTNRTYRINRNHVRSACCNLARNKSGTALLFITFTLPFDISDKDVSRIWKIVVSQLRNQYKVTGYVWVREYQKQGRIHYHIIIDKAYISIKKLQKTYNNAIHHITGIMPEYQNSVRLGANPRIYSVKRVKNYLSKYITKDCKGKMNKDQLQKYLALQAMGIEDGVFLRKAYGYSTMKFFKDVYVAWNSDFLHDIYEFSKHIYTCDFYSVTVLSEKNKLFRQFITGNISVN